MTNTESATYIYTVSDITTVLRRFTADIVMIAQSSGGMTEDEARDYAHDVESLALRGYLKKVDLTLFSGLTEVRATQYSVNTAAGDLTMSRPGGVMWPCIANPDFRIVLSYTEAYDNTARQTMKGKLKISWIPTKADTSHTSLIQNGGRDYASNGWGLQRKDYNA